MIRIMALIRYPEGVSMEEGDRWYLGTHTQEAKRLDGLVLYRTWRSEEIGTQRRPGRQWQRMTELGFADFEAWRRAQDKGPNYTPPPYGTRGFLTEGIFIGDKPQYDFLRDNPKVD